MAKSIEVKFLRLQGTEEVYIATGIPKKTYIRKPCQERVVWATSSLSDNGTYEASSPLKAGATIRVISRANGNKTTVFEETIETDASATLSAKKQALLVCEQLAVLARKTRQELALHSYEDWSKWLMQECARCDYSGYPENWLHYGTKPSQKAKAETLEIYGVPYTVVITEWQHMVCDHTWQVVEIQDAQNNTVELCGYAFN